MEVALDIQQQPDLASVSSSATDSDEETFTAQIVQAFLWIEAKLCAKLKVQQQFCETQIII